MAEKKSKKTLLLFIASLLAGLLLFSGTAAGAGVSIDPPVIALSPGDSTTFNLTLDSAPYGLSGYKIGINLEQPGIAEVSAVTFPSWAGIPESKGIPGSDVQILAVDLGGKVEKNATQVILATLTLQGKRSGTSPVLLSRPVFHDDDGNNISPSLTGSSVTVSDGTPVLSGSSGAGSGGVGSSAIPGTVTSPVLNQSGAEVTVQVTITGGNQTPAMETPSIGGTATIPPTTDDQAVPGTPTSRGIPFLSLPFVLMAIGIMAFLAAKKR